MDPPAGLATTSRAWYEDSINRFCVATESHVLGQLAANGTHALLLTQRDAWREQIEILRATLAGLTGTVLLEYSIPRMGRRVDAIVLVSKRGSEPENTL